MTGLTISKFSVISRLLSNDGLTISRHDLTMKVNELQRRCKESIVEVHFMTGSSVRVVGARSRKYTIPTRICNDIDKVFAWTNEKIDKAY